MTEGFWLSGAILFLGFAFGLVLLGYEQLSRMRGWPIGSRFRGFGWPKALGVVVFIGAVIASVAVMPWWFIFVTILLGTIVGFVLTEILRPMVQPVVLIGCIICFLVAPAYVW